MADDLDHDIAGMVERLRAHFWQLAFFVGFADRIEAQVRRVRAHVKRLSVVESLSNPNEFLQFKLDRVIARRHGEQRAGVDRSETQAVGLAQIIKFIDGDQPAGPRFVDDVDARFSRDMSFKMACYQARDYVAAATGRRTDEVGHRLTVEKTLPCLSV